MMKVGYIRVSTTRQNLDRQLKQMVDEKVDKFFEEKISGKDTNRAEFQKMLSFVRQGDVVIVTSLDRLGRNYDDIKSTVSELHSKNVALKILDAPFLNFNTGNRLLDKAMFDMFLSLLSYIAQNEREKIKDRQREGIALAKEKGVYKGRPSEYSPITNDPQKKIIYETVCRLLNQQVSITTIAKTVGLSRPTIYKIKKIASQVD
ncbi:recombinase family protein [Enterococcus phoeniculicola]|uniref:recombinase family protein n=1 Tax=Enterococcus phoeniculicola TaxID=154621 RepID=UPI00055862D2|nr:recombinase family protein [Enterococcus phoeniculicola]